MAASTGVTPDIPGILNDVITDLSGVVFSTADIIHYVSRLASAAQKLNVDGPQKLEYVVRAGHIMVDRFLPEADREAAHGLITIGVPATVQAILDVAKGRVEIGPAILATVETIVKSPGASSVARSLLGCCM